MPSPLFHPLTAHGIAKATEKMKQKRKFPHNVILSIFYFSPSGNEQEICSKTELRAERLLDLNQEERSALAL